MFGCSLGRDHAHASMIVVDHVYVVVMLIDDMMC